MKIREMQPSDDKMAVSRIYEAAWRAGYRGMIPEDFLASLPEGHWCSALESPDALYLLCLEQNEFPIGVCSLAREKEEIISLYVLPERWGKGIGTLLLEAAWDIFLARGCSGAFLWVLAENRRARLFYEARGFSPDGGSLWEEIGGKRLRLLRYRREKSSRE